MQSQAPQQVVAVEPARLSNPVHVQDSIPVPLLPYDRTARTAAVQPSGSQSSAGKAAAATCPQVRNDKGTEANVLPHVAAVHGDGCGVENSALSMDHDNSCSYTLSVTAEMESVHDIVDTAASVPSVAAVTRAATGFTSAYLGERQKPLQPQQAALEAAETAAAAARVGGSDCDNNVPLPPPTQPQRDSNDAITTACNLAAPVMPKSNDSADSCAYAEPLQQKQSSTPDQHAASVLPDAVAHGYSCKEQPADTSTDSRQPPPLYLPAICASPYQSAGMDAVTSFDVNNDAQLALPLGSASTGPLYGLRVILDDSLSPASGSRCVSFGN